MRHLQDRPYYRKWTYSLPDIWPSFNPIHSELKLPDMQIQTQGSILSLKRQCHCLYGSFSTRYMGNSRLTGRVWSNAPIKIQWGKHRKMEDCRKSSDLCWVYSMAYILEHLSNPFHRLKLLVTFSSPSLTFPVNFHIISEIFCFVLLPLFCNSSFCPACWCGMNPFNKEEEGQAEEAV